MGYQANFKRYEIKFLLDPAQTERLLQVMEPYMALDRYGRTTICNIYYDTENYRLARRSVEKPVYKEKLRVRSYGKTEPGSPVFVELKKKYNGIVYKRRVSIPERDAVAWLAGGAYAHKQNQISREIDWFLQYYQTLRPVAYLSYERRAYFSRDGGDFRITLDENILCRRQALSLCEESCGQLVLPRDKVLMEVKTPGSIPLWLTEFLSREKIYKTSFSKYGTAYQTMILPNFKGECIYA